MTKMEQMLSKTIDSLLKLGYRGLILRPTDVYPHHYEICACHIADSRPYQYVFYLLEDGSIDEIPF